MDAGSPASPEQSGPGYNGAAVAGAVLATLFFPLIALIAALLLQGNEDDPRKRAQLRTWAWASGGLLAFGAVLGVVLASITLH
jgi:heme A synthase